MKTYRAIPKKEYLIRKERVYIYDKVCPNKKCKKRNKNTLTSDSKAGLGNPYLVDCMFCDKPMLVHLKPTYYDIIMREITEKEFFKK